MYLGAAQARGASAAAADGRDMRRFRALLALKAAAELGGAALAVAQHGCAGATLVVAGHFAFNSLNAELVTKHGAVHALDADGRKPLVAVGAALTALGLVACAAAEAPAAYAPLALAASGAFTAATAGWVLFKAACNTNWIYW